MEKPTIGITKTNKQIKKATNTPFYNKIREFFADETEVKNAKQITKILNQLHDIDYENIYDKNFTLTYKNLKKDRNMSYLDYDFDDETQAIVIANDWKKSSSNLLKKCTIIDAYFHELTHEKQLDFALISEYYKKTSPVEKLINLEFLEIVKYLPYELKLCEVYARIEATRRNVDLLKKGLLPLNTETLFCSLSNIDDILFTFNRFNVVNGDIEFDIDKFLVRYFASMKLSVIKNKEDEKTYSFLNSDNFKLKVRIELGKKLDKFKKDIEYIYSQLTNCYKMSKKFAQKLNLNASRLDAVSENMKDYKYNDYFLNVIYQDLKDKLYLRKNINDIHISKRKYFQTNLEKENDIGE